MPASQRSFDNYLDGDFSVINETEHDLLVKKLLDAGFTGGWVLQGDVLILWEHDEDPPKPLTRPK